MNEIQYTDFDVATVCDNSVATEPSRLEREERRPLGAFRLTRTRLDAGTIVHARPNEPRFGIRLIASGYLTLLLDDVAERLDGGDVVVSDAAKPHTWVCDCPCSLMTLWVGERDLRRHFPQATTVHLKGRQGVARTVALMLRSVWDAAPGLSPEVGARLADSVLAVMTAAIQSANGEVDTTPATAARLFAIKRHIERRLHEPALGVKSVATAFGISPRYLHMLFTNEDDSVSGYILRRRLEQCAGQLRDPSWRQHTITEIAFAWGFNSMAHFARVFRRRYGLTAREWRHEI